MPSAILKNNYGMLKAARFVSGLRNFLNKVLDFLAFGYGADG
jgi:hypothetical protein